MTGRTTCLAAILTTLIHCPWSAGAQAASSDTVLFRETFEAGLGDRWLERGFPSIRRRNTFSLAVEADGNRYLKVDSDRSTSGKGIWLRFDPRACPSISWRWRISNVIAGADLHRKEGDDSAAKLYVVFDGQSGWNPLDKQLLIYVWDNRLPAGTVLANAWEPTKARMVVLESGPVRVDQWVPEQVDVANDYARAFPGESPGDVEALVFMADTDNTSSRVSAGFDDLEIRCMAPPETSASGTGGHEPQSEKDLQPQMATDEHRSGSPRCSLIPSNVTRAMRNRKRETGNGRQETGEWAGIDRF